MNTFFQFKYFLRGKVYKLDKSCEKIGHDIFRGATSIEEMWRHGVCWALRLQRRLSEEGSHWCHLFNRGPLFFEPPFIGACVV
jgi:hypothetical protein